MFKTIEEFVQYYKPKIIYLDIDGVLIHSCQAICDILNEKQGTDFKGNQIFTWNFKEACPNLTDKDIEDMFADPIFFQYVEWMDGAKTFLNKHKNNTMLLTKGTKENIRLKRIFFKEFDISIIGFSFNESKGLVNMQGGLFIDDCTKNLNETNATYKIQFIEYDDGMNNKREWIKGWDGIKMSKWS